MLNLSEPKFEFGMKYSVALAGWRQPPEFEGRRRCSLMIMVGKIVVSRSGSLELFEVPKAK